MAIELDIVRPRPKSSCPPSPRGRLRNPASSVGHAGASASSQLTFHLDHSMQAGQARHAGAKMVVSSKEVGPNRFRETFGRYYEDFEPGHIYEHRPSRTITQQDNIWFTLLTMNKHPIHFDEEYAKHSEFGRCLVASPLTVAILVGMSVSDVSQKAIANLGWKEIRLTHPVFAGDTLSGESEVLEKRESKSRLNAGIVSVRTRGFNQDKKLVCEFDRTILVPKRGFGVEDEADY
jgi:itaconyl-CoA hydratase